MQLFSAVAFSAVFLQVQGHMLLSKPARFPGTGDNAPLNGPTTGGTSNYPCKVEGNYKFDFARTQIAPGSSYEVQFEGQATHGGGSCQFALSPDLEPNAQSDFKVIHSIEGGCPAQVAGNMGGDWSAPDPYTFNFTMPSDIPAGKYTFAWAWFNRVGNREMYMNCAPIEVTGGSQKRDISSRQSAGGLDSLPNLFLANILDSPNCATADSTDLIYPDPGQSLVKYMPSNMKQPPTVNGGDISSCYAPVSVKAAPPSGSGQAPHNSNYGSGYGSYGYNSGSGSGSYTPSSSVAPVPAPTSAPYPISNGSTPTPSSSGSCASGQVSCTTSGSIICLPDSQFGICNFGCAIPQALAAGTSCSNGVISKRAIRFPPQVRPNRIYAGGHRLFGLL